jgi:hypothetical protein
MSLPVRKSEDPEGKAALAMLGARERFHMLLEIAADHHVSFSGWALEFDAAAQELVRRFGALQEIGIPPSGVVKWNKFANFNDDLLVRVAACQSCGHSGEQS